MSTLDAPTTPVGRHSATTSSGRTAAGVVDPVPAGPDVPDAPVDVTRRSGPAVTALVVALVSFFLSTVPIVNAVSVVGGLVAVVLATRALRGLAPGASGRGDAVAGIVLGVVASVVAVVVWALLGSAAKALGESGDLSAPPATADTAASPDLAGVGPSMADDLR